MFACGDSPTSASRPAFSGHWVGSYVVRQCASVEGSSCDVAPERVNQAYPLDLILTQSGTTVSGMLQVVESPVMTVPVTGDVSSDTLAIGGSVTNPVFNRVATDNIRITRWTTTRDNRDNLAGTFSFRWQTVWGPASAPQNTGVRTLDYDAELVNVFRQP
jgi:hypothetical protein